MPFKQSCWIFLVLLLVTACKKDKLDDSKVIKIDSHTIDRLNKVIFVNGIGYVAGGERFSKATILVSKDGGANWVAKDFPEAGKGMYGIASKYDDLGVYAIGFDGKVLETTDNGDNWNYIKLADPGRGKYELVSVTRNDGQVIPLDNAWLTFVTLPAGRQPVYESKFHFVDKFPSTAGVVSGSSPSMLRCIK